MGKEIQFREVKNEKSTSVTRDEGTVTLSGKGEGINVPSQGN